MTQILPITRDLPTETLSYEAPSGFDGQGKPTFSGATSFDANVLLYDGRAGEESIIAKDGSEIRTALTLYIVGDAPAVPEEGARVTRNGVRYIVAEKKVVSGLFYTADEPDHIRLRCRIA